MSKVEMNAYEAVLRMCASAAPQAWHPQQYSRRSGTPMETVNGVLKELWDLGLLEKAPAHPDHGPGLRLSAKGWEVLNDPKALHRLCSSDSLMPAADGGYTHGPRTDARSRDEQTSHLLESLRASGVSYVSWLLFGANVVVFLIGLYLAYRVGAAMDYLGGVKTLIAVAVFLGLFVAFNVRAIARYLDGTVRIFVLLGLMFLAYKTNLFLFPLGGAADPIRHRLGLLSASDWLHGEWWRALTACFVHLGLLHLMANMSMLYNGGWFIERMWGHGRFFAIYVVAGITGSLTGLAFNPNGLAGASGALCGLVAAEAVWVMFNGKYLPPRLRQEWWNNLSLNLMLLVAISFVPGVSFWGHAGGAAAGAAAAVCLHYQRFGAPVWRWAALLGLLLIPFGGLYCLDYQRHHNEMWGEVEILNFKQEYKHDIGVPLTPEMRAAFQERVRPVLVDQRAERRADVDIQAAQAVLADQRQQLEAWQVQLKHLGPYINDRVKTAREDRQKALDAVTARLDLYERMERCLKEGENFPANEDKTLREQIAATPELQTREERRLADVKKHEETEEERQAREKREGEEEEAKFEKEHLQDISGKLKTAKTLFDGDLTDYLDRPPSEWVAETLKKNLEKIEKSRKQLKTLMELLPTLGPYKSETIRTALERATACAPELATLLEMAQHRFEAGDKWTKDEQTALKKQEMKVDDLYKAWRSSLAK